MLNPGGGIYKAENLCFLTILFLDLMIKPLVLMVITLYATFDLKKITPICMTKVVSID